MLSKRLAAAGLFVFIAIFLANSAIAADFGSKVAPTASAVVDLAAIEAFDRAQRAAEQQPTPRVAPEHPRGPAQQPPLGQPAALPQIPQSPQSKRPDRPLAPALAASFEALSDNYTSIPPDTQGAVGPNHLMVTLNTQVRIQSKTGAVISTVSLVNWWKTGIPDATDVFDPKVVYDSVSGRWIFTVCADRSNAKTGVLLAVSGSSDPTGAWYMWRFQGDPSGAVWVDYPGLGVNANWITVTANLFKMNGEDFRGVAIWAVDKNSAYSGAASPTATLFTKNDADTGYTIIPALTYDAYQAVQHLICAFDASNLRLYSLTGSAANPVWNVGQSIAVQPFAADLPQAPQPDTDKTVDPGDRRIMNAVFRNGSLWCAHGVGLPSSAPTHVAARWYQIDPGASALLQQGTVDDFATNGAFYFYPTIAVNASNQVLLGFAGAGQAIYIGGYYTYRDVHTPANAMESVSVLKAGEAAYYKTNGGTSNRWGDYSATCVDPVDDLTMWTLQEYAASFAQNVWSTWWGKLAASQQPNLAIFWRNARNGCNAVELYNNLARVSVAPLPPVANTNWLMATVSAFSANNVGRVFWRNPRNGKNSMETLQGVAHLNYAALRDVANANWRISGAADFNGDGATSLLWRNIIDGRNAIENLDANFQHLSYTVLEQTADKVWRPAAVADFNADGKPDIVWRNTVDGRNVIWLMNGATFVSYTPFPKVADLNWSIVGAADFNADGRPDILWRNTSTGRNVIWLMNGATFVSYQDVSPVANLDWYAAGAANMQ